MTILMSQDPLSVVSPFGSPNILGFCKTHSVVRDGVRLA